MSGRGLDAQAPRTGPSADPPQRALLNRYCIGCHNERVRSGNLMLDRLDMMRVGQEPQTWEKVVRKLRAGLMPPSGRPRPDEAAHAQFLAWLSGELDRAALGSPNPGRTETFHRLNRTEYQNAIRDLLALDIDVAEFLPADDSSYGFDNIAGVLKVSQSLMERYLSTAKTLSRMAVGGPPPALGAESYRVAPDSQQHDRVGDLPFGTRGGLLVQHLFPQDAEYDIKIELTGAANPRDEHKLEVTIDGRQVKLFTVAPRGSQTANYRSDIDGRLEVRVPVSAGPHEVGVAFFRRPPDLVEQVREPFQNPRISGNDGGVGGAMPSLAGLSIVGPHGATGAGDTPSRRRIFTCRPDAPAQELACATTILSAMARRAYRAPVAADDLQVLLDFFREGRQQGGSFDAGIEHAVRRLLVDPNFLFRVEADPRSAARPAGPGVYALDDLGLASRLSFFLWSSIPDDELLDLAMAGTLKESATLDRQVRRMLADPRSASLTTNFAAQWLLLRNLDTARPGDPYSLTFDETLREGFRRETELFFDSIVRENRPVIELLTADYTFLNERLANHYGMLNVQGSHFRRVSLDEGSPRRGLLGKGAVLTITSHAIRTSPVIRGKWILNNVLGTPPPDPPANVPALVDRKTQAKLQTIRERMSQHRSNPVCASCHSMIDPAGFALESFDAIGRWRSVDEFFNPIDASGTLPDGTPFSGVAELRAALAARPERFVNTVAERLLTYALGRGLEYYDMPAVRRIVRDSARDQYRFQSIVLGVVQSYPFLNRRTDGPARLETSASRP